MEVDGEEDSFKKPVLIGKIGKLPKKVSSGTSNEIANELEEGSTTKQQEDVKKTESSDNISVPYKEPSWSGLPQSAGKDYSFEVLKDGSIIDRIDLMSNSFWVFGRLTSCDIHMAHPTISRFHAVLQYRSTASEEFPIGFYLYDLNSTHGTFLNKFKMKPRQYVRVQVGYMIKLGCSRRMYILNGPADDAEEPSELSITELKQQRAEELLRREVEEKENARLVQEAEAARRLKEEERGIDWGMGEDADEESDLTENPFAQTNNEELYIDDPKKTLRGFMEREGLELEYDLQVQEMGHVICKVLLPIDDERGRPTYAEVLHKGKKKDAVVQCALEACKILDRHGLLRQATHESRKRKEKNWEENDFYDSDDDTFFDRTGAIEKKRESRMKAKLPQQPETYQSLVEKEAKIAEEIAQIEQRLSTTAKDVQVNDENDEEDTLDSYMKQLKQPTLDKDKMSKLKSDLNRLRLERESVIKLINIARPADLPPLVSPAAQPAKSDIASKSKLPIFGKRMKVKVQKPSVSATPVKIVNEDIEEDEDEDGEEVRRKTLLKNSIQQIEEEKRKELEEVNEDKAQDNERKKKRNQRRAQYKHEIERQKGYEEDASKEDYNMWMPPENQTGDGKTALNDKYGY